MKYLDVKKGEGFGFGFVWDLEWKVLFIQVLIWSFAFGKKRYK